MLKKCGSNISVRYYLAVLFSCIILLYYVAVLFSCTLLSITFDHFYVYNLAVFPFSVYRLVSLLFFIIMLLLLLLRHR